MIYKIIGVYRGEKEELDSADTRKEAQYLRGEYRLAFGNSWRIYIKKGKSNEQGE